MSTYMTVLILSGIIPLLASFWPGLKFYQNIRSLANQHYSGRYTLLRLGCFCRLPGTLVF